MRAAAYPEPSLRRLPWYAAVAVVSVRRHPVLYALVAAATFGAAAALLAVVPPTYEVRCRLVVRSPPASAPTLDEGTDAPPRSAARLLRGDAELRALARDTDLVEVARRRRPAVLRLADRLRGRGAPPADVVDGLAKVLGERVTVVARRDGVVELTAHWTDPDTALELARAAQRRYLEVWQGLEVSSISMAIDILERRADALRAELDRRLADTRGVAAARGRGGLPEALQEAPAAWGRESPGGDEEGDGAAVANVDRPPRGGSGGGPRRIVRSPIDRDTRLRMRALRLSLPLGVDPEPDDVAPDAVADAPSSANEGHPSSRRAPGLGELDRRLGDRLVESARSGAQGVEQAYAAVAARLESARIELDTSRAAFDERYLVVAPPALPRAPVSPDGEAILVAAALDALLLAGFVTALVDLRSLRGSAAAAASGPDAGEEEPR